MSGYPNRLGHLLVNANEENYVSMRTLKPNSQMEVSTRYHSQIQCIWTKYTRRLNLPVQRIKSRVSGRGFCILIGFFASGLLGPGFLECLLLDLLLEPALPSCDLLKRAIAARIARVSVR